MKRTTFLPGLVFAGMLALILDGQTALAGARTGIGLCLQTVIPALFPFIVLSSLLMGCSFPVLRPLGRLCRIPEGAEGLLIPAFLGGYPVGAQSVAGAWQVGSLNKEEAERLLAFCNNAGPSFIFGLVASLFPSPWMAWALWAIHLTSAILTARVMPGRAKQTVSAVPAQNMGVSEALLRGVRVMGVICGWVVLMRVVIAFLQRWVFFIMPVEAQVLLTGLLELTNGCLELRNIQGVPLRFTTCACLLAAGGLCVSMQTASVTRGLSLKYYYRGKALQMLFSLLLCTCLFGGFYAAMAAGLVFSVLILGKMQKRAGIPGGAGI